MERRDSVEDERRRASLTFLIFFVCFVPFVVNLFYDSRRVFQTGSWCDSAADSNHRVMVVFCWV
jgi:hypothetical protein